MRNSEGFNHVIVIRFRQFHLEIGLDIALVVAAAMAVLVMNTPRASAANRGEEQKVKQSEFDRYAEKVKSLSQTARPENRAVIATMRIPAGTTIDEKWLQLIPLIEYRQTSSSVPDPNLLKRPADEFGSVSEVAGRIALADIEEQGKVRRSQVGRIPREQFVIDQNTHVRLHYYFRSGAILPGAPATIHECTLDTSDLSQAEGAELRKRIAESKLLQEPDTRFEELDGGSENYTLETTIRSVTKKLCWTGKGAPYTIWPLVAYLEARSKKESIPASKEFLERHRAP
jgi:hypothetical protein